MPSAAPPVRLTDRKRAAILAAAVAEFRVAGYDATSMDRIAASAGVSKRTVYNHFPSKDALFLQILGEMMARGGDAMDLAYRADAPVRGQLLELARRKLRLLHDPDFADLARIAIVAGLHHPELAREMIARLDQREAGLAVWIRAAAADGRLRAPDPAFAAQQLESLLKGAAFWPQLAMGQPPLTATQEAVVATAAVEMFLAYYG